MGLSVRMLGFGEDDMTRLITLLFCQGVLDEQFTQLRQLQDESSPNFVSEVISIYFQESERHLNDIRALLLGDGECTDYGKMAIPINQLMGSSSSIGAKRMTSACIAFRAASEHASWTGCVRSLAVLEHEYCYLKNKLHEFLQIEQQRVIAAGVRYHPPLEADQCFLRKTLTHIECELLMPQVPLPSTQLPDAEIYVNCTVFS